MQSVNEGEARHHAIERTSPKGGPFVGTCMLCGKTGLPASAALERCENQRGLSSDDAVIAAILGDDNS